MKKFVAILTLWVVLLEPVSAADTFLFPQIFTQNRSCGAWTAARRANGFEARTFEVWVLGYMSGVNAMMDKNQDILAEITDGHGLYAWIDNFCGAEPLKNIPDAALALAIELMQRTPRR